MTDNTLRNSPAYRVAYSMYVALGGDPMTEFNSVEEIYDAIDVLFGKGNNRITVETIAMEIVENGDYNFDDEEVTGYKPVNIKVDVPQKYTDEQVENIRVEAENTGYNNGYGVGMNEGYSNGYTEGFTTGETEGYNDGYSEGLDDGAEDQKALLEEITITENGVYEKEDGYKKVTVEVEGVADSRPMINNGFAFTGGDIALVDFSQYNWSRVYDTKSFFNNCSHSTNDWSNFENNFNGEVLTCHNMFNFSSGFKSIPQLDTSKVTNMSSMFYYCSGLTSIPQLDTSKVTNMSSMFYYCSGLTSIPQLDTSKVTNMSSMFHYCSGLTSIPQLDTSKVTNMSSMFEDCNKLTAIPQLDTSNVTNMQRMFYRCNTLTTIPQLDTSKVTKMNYMFYSCPQLTTVPELDASNLTDMQSIFDYSNNIVDFGGLKDLGKQPTVYNTNLTALQNATYTTAMNVINNLYDRASAGYSVLKLSLHANVRKLLSEEDIAIATNKGWTIS